MEDAHLAGQGHVLGHRATEGGDHPAAGPGGVGDLLDAVQVAGEAGGDDALAGVGGEQVTQDPADGPLAGGVARLLGVGRVGQEHPDPVLVGDGADAGQVGGATVDGGEVELEVARVQDHALGGVEGGGEAVGHRVGDGDQLDVEGPDVPALAVLDRHQPGPVEQAGLLDAVAGQPERQR